MTMTAHHMAPTMWGESLSGAPVLDRAVSNIVPALVRRWQGIAPDIEQAALDQHCLSIHLGGPKRLSRAGEGGARTCDVPLGAHSVIPAGSAFHWKTEGPIDFMHIYFDPITVDHVISDAFDRNPARVSLSEGLGESDVLVRSLALGLIDELASDDVHPAYLDDLLHLMLCRVLRLHSNARDTNERARHTLAPFRLRRAIDFIEESLAAPIGVAEIAAASGISPYHFSRAFRQSTGRPPYAFLLERRVVRAKAMLINGDTTLTAIARDCGFASLSQFSRMFRQQTGATPSRYRDQH